MKTTKRDKELFESQHYNRRMTRPLTYSLSRSLSFPLNGIAGLDPDAASYIANLEGDGVSLSDAQKTAIDTFYVTGKDEGWYSEVARLYLPIWGQASSNARCLVSGTSGTFVGTVTHASGYIQSSARNGYFDTGNSAVAKGLTSSVGGYGFLQVAPDSAGAKAPMGAIDFSDFTNLLGLTANQAASSLMFYYGAIYASGVTATTITGSRIYSCWLSGGSLFLDDRTSSGFNNLANTTASGASIGAVNDYILAENFHAGIDAANNPYGGQLGAAFYHKWTDSSYNENFTLALKNLWETCTGLSLS